MFKYTRGHTQGVLIHYVQWRTQEFFSGGRGVQQIHLRAEEREREGDLRTVTHSQGFWRQL